MIMQTQPEHLKRQQAILKKHGFYNGKIDGIWGPSSIAAKKAFEASPDFKPGYPNNGMPFKGTGPYPKGIRVGAKGMLQCEGIEEILADAARSAVDKQNASKELEVKVEAEPEVEAIEPEVESLASEPEAKPLVAPIQQGNHKKKKHRRN